MSTEVLEQTDRLVLKRIYQCTLDAMWAAWTEAEQLAKWFGCEQTRNVKATLDVRPGGSYEVEMGHEEGGCFRAVGRFTEVAPKTRLAYTWEWKGDEQMEFGETQVEVEFREIGGSVELTLTHSGFPSADLVPIHNQGWSGSLEKLEAHLQGA